MVLFKRQNSFHHKNNIFDKYLKYLALRSYHFVKATARTLKQTLFILKFDNLCLVAKNSMGAHRTYRPHDVDAPGPNCTFVYLLLQNGYDEDESLDAYL